MPSAVPRRSSFDLSGDLRVGQLAQSGHRAQQEVTGDGQDAL